MEIGKHSAMRLIGLFDEFAETGILTRMIHAAMKAMNQLMDPKQRSKFPISNIWDVGNRLEEDIDHWFDIHLIFQSRRAWYKRYCGMLSEQGLPLPLSTSSIPEIAMPFLV